MNRTEARLRDLFDAIDRQVGEHEARPPVATIGRTRRPWVRLLAAAAAVVVAAGSLTAWWAVSRRPEPSPVLDATIDALEFDRAAGQVCLALDRARNGVAPRFQTPEAYLVVTEDRRRALDIAVASLLAIPEPDDDGALPAAAVNRLREVEPVLAAVEDAARAGRIEDAAAAWALVDPAIDAALEPLGRGRTGPCAREGE